MTWTVLATVLAGPAFAQNNEVKRFLNAATTLYENLEYEKALKQLQKARAKATGTEDELKISLLEGVVLADLGKEERALTAFKTAFGFELEAKLPVEVSPKVSIIAEKARANVRKLLAPQLEREKQERRAIEEKQRADEHASALAAQLKRDEEEKARTPPPPARLEAPAPKAPSAGLRVGAWVAGGVGLLGAGAATAFLLVANNDYLSLKNGTVAVGDAASARDMGKRFASLGYAFTAVAVAGVATSVVLFVLSGQSSPAPAPVAFSVTPSGAFVTLQGAF
jgi:tetratricopeptide (TPR) repeat protein